MAKQKIVLKVRYPDQESDAKQNGFSRGPDVITVWNYRRIAAAGSILLVLTGSVAYYLAGGEGGKNPEARASSAAVTNLPEGGDKVPGSEAVKPRKPQKIVSEMQQAVPVVGITEAVASQDSGGSGSPLASREPEKIRSTAEVAATATGQAYPDSVADSAAALTADTDVEEDGQKNASSLPVEPVVQAAAEAASGMPGIAAEQSSFAVSSHLKRSLLTTRVVQREPVDRVQGPVHAEPDRAFQLCMFTELQGLKGQKVIHRWSLNGKEVFSKHFRVRGDRWRVHSSKLLNQKMLGAWQVEVIKDGSNVLLDRQQFELLPPS